MKKQQPSHAAIRQIHQLAVSIQFFKSHLMRPKQETFASRLIKGNECSSAVAANNKQVRNVAVVAVVHSLLFFKCILTIKNHFLLVVFKALLNHALT
jgi:hypothetical protein